MLLPSLTIHSIVKYSALALKKWGVQNVRVRQWLPSALGCASFLLTPNAKDLARSHRSFAAHHSLGFIPFLPALFDEPVEEYVDSTFDRLERKLYPDADSPVRRAFAALKHHTQELHEQADKEKKE